MNQRNIFFSSDHHFFHENVIKYSNRPFKDVEEMNHEMITRHNQVVTPQDIVYFLGDFCFTTDVDAIVKILKSMNGEKHFIPGNHDKIMYKDIIKKQFNSFCMSSHKEIYVADEEAKGGKMPITLCHYAMRVWNKSHYGAYHLYGHSHGTLEDLPDSLSFDVGVDCFNYTPVSYPEVKAIMAKKTWEPPFKNEDEKRKLNI